MSSKGERKSRKSSSKSSSSKSSSSSKRSAKPSSRSKSTSRSPAPKKGSAGGNAPSDEPKPSVLPNDILKAVAIAKKSDKDDKHGYGAFRFDLTRLRTHKGAKGTTRYIPFEVNVNNEWRPMCIRFENLKTKGKIPPPDDIEKRQYGLSVLYYASSTFDQKDRKGEVIATQEYGKAVSTACKAFQYYAKGMLKRKEITNRNKTIVPFVQFLRKNKKTDEEPTIPVEDPLIRVKLGYNDEGQFTIPQGIRDIRKKMTAKERKRSPTTMPYNMATVEGDDEKEEELNVDNIHLFLRYGAPTFGVHDLSQMCLSQSGISVPTSFGLLAAKQPTSTRSEASTHFEADTMDNWGDAESSEPESGDEDEDGADKASDAEGDYGDFDDAVADGSAEGSGEGSDLDAAMSEEGSADGSGEGSEGSEGSADGSDDESE